MHLSSVSSATRNLCRLASVSALGAALLISAPSAMAHARHHHRHHHSRLHRAHRHRAHVAAGAPSYCANADADASWTNTQAMRDAVVCLINQQRGARHLPLLQASSLLNRSAQNWTNWMVATGNFTHGAD